MECVPPEERIGLLKIIPKNGGLRVVVAAIVTHRRGDG